MFSSTVKRRDVLIDGSRFDYLDPVDDQRSLSPSFSGPVYFLRMCQKTSGADGNEFGRKVSSHLLLIYISVPCVTLVYVFPLAINCYEIVFSNTQANDETPTTTLGATEKTSSRLTGTSTSLSATENREDHTGDTYKEIRPSSDSKNMLSVVHLDRTDTIVPAGLSESEQRILLR